MDGSEQLEVIVPAVAGIIAQIRPDQLTSQTPCADWTVRHLLNHMIGGATAFAAGFRGEPLPDMTGPLPDLAGDDPAAAFGEAVSSFGAATRLPGAIDRVLHVPFGAVEGREFLRFVALDGLVHGWDLCQATSQEYQPDEAVVAAVEDFARRFLRPELRGVAFAEEVESGATTTRLERLVAFTGRRP